MVRANAPLNALTPELKEFVNAKVRSGMYADAGEVIREGLRLLRERELGARQIGQAIEEGWRAAEAGDLSDGESFMEELEQSTTKPRRRRGTRR